MSAMADKIMKRVRAKGRGWVFTPKHFIDFGTRGSVDMALSRLAQAGEVRRVGRGLYDYPKLHHKLGALTPDAEMIALDVQAGREFDGQLGERHAQAAQGALRVTLVPEQGREFGVAFEWDLPLLDGYSYTVMENVAVRPSLTEFRGCDTPQVYREIRRGRFDAVIVNGWVVKTCLQALLACKLSGTPCIVRGEVNGLRPRAGWKRWLHARLLARYDAALASRTLHATHAT